MTSATASAIGLSAASTAAARSPAIASGTAETSSARTRIGANCAFAPAVRAHEAAQLHLGRLDPLRRLALEPAEPREFSVLGEQLLDPRRPEGADELALEIGVAREEAERLELVEPGSAEARSLDGAAHVVRFPAGRRARAPRGRIGVAGRARRVGRRGSSRRPSTPRRVRRHEVDAELLGERLQGETVALALHEHDGADAPA